MEDNIARELGGAGVLFWLREGRGDRGVGFLLLVLEDFEILVLCCWLIGLPLRM